MRTDTSALIEALHDARTRIADAVYALTVLEAQRLGLKVRLYDEARAGGKTQKDSEDLVRIHPDYVAHQQQIGGQEHARDLLMAEAERLKYTVQLQIATLHEGAP